MIGYSDDGEKLEGPDTLSRVVDYAIRGAWLHLEEDALQNPLDRVTAVRLIEEFAEQRKGLVVHAARKSGATWQQIGDALGISRQGAQQQYGFLDR